MIKYIPAQSLNQTADFSFARYCITLPPKISLEDLFKPIAWAHVKAQLKKNDVVRVIAEDGSFDVDLTVREVEVGGAHMVPRPHIAGLGGAEALTKLSEIAVSATPSMVPVGLDGQPVVKVQYLPATKWRVIGLTGSEVSRNHTSEKDARRAMATYLASAGLEMPKLDEAKIEKAKAETNPEPARKMSASPPASADRPVAKPDKVRTKDAA